jgi:hypothetical protein
MHYQVSRDGQMYGPYTFEDLKRYLASGNVLPADLVKSEEMADWIPVSQLMAGEQASAPTTGFSTPVYDPAQTTYVPAAGAFTPNPGIAASRYPDAPNLHWGLYLLFAILTCGLFSKVMTCVQASWMKKVQANSQALIFYLAAYVLWVVNQFRDRHILNDRILMFTHHTYYTPHTAAGSSALGFFYFVLIIVSRFMMRASLQEHFNTVEPIGLNLNPVLTFFFGGVYFQSELNRINAMKQAARLGAGRTY